MRPLLLALILTLTLISPALGAWRRPVSGDVARPFSFGPDPFRAGWHRGVDLSAAPGARVRATCTGRVVTARPGLVTLRCGPWRVTHLPLAAVTVRAGTAVLAGAPIGTLGTGPGHTGLHLGVRRAGDRFGYVDPMPFLTGRSTPPPAAPAPRARIPRTGPGTSRRAQPPRSPIAAPPAQPAPAARPAAPLGADLAGPSVAPPLPSAPLRSDPAAGPGVAGRSVAAPLPAAPLRADPAGPSVAAPLPAAPLRADPAAGSGVAGRSVAAPLPAAPLRADPAAGPGVAGRSVAAPLPAAPLRADPAGPSVAPPLPAAPVRADPAAGSGVAGRSVAAPLPAAPLRADPAGPSVAAPLPAAPLRGAPHGRIRVFAPAGARALAPWPAWAGLALLLVGAAGGGVRFRARRRRALLSAAVPSAP